MISFQLNRIEITERLWVDVNTNADAFERTVSSVNIMFKTFQRIITKFPNMENELCEHQSSFAAFVVGIQSAKWLSEWKRVENRMKWKEEREIQERKRISCLFCLSMCVSIFCNNSFLQFHDHVVMHTSYESQKYLWNFLCSAQSKSKRKKSIFGIFN